MSIYICPPNVARATDLRVETNAAAPERPIVASSADSRHHVVAQGAYQALRRAAHTTAAESAPECKNVSAVRPFRRPSGDTTADRSGAQRQPQRAGRRSGDRLLRGSTRSYSTP